MKTETQIPLWRRISFRLALRSVFVALVLGLVFSILQLVIDYSEQNKQLDRTVSNMLAAAEKPAMIAAFQLDAELAHEVINGLFAYEFVVNSRIEDEFSDTLVEQKRNIKPTAFSWLSRLVDEEQKLHVVDLFTQERVIVKSGVWAFSSSGDLIILHDFDTVFKFNSSNNFPEAVEAA